MDLTIENKDKMNLSFSTHWKKDMPQNMAGQPNYFPEKIINSLDLPLFKKMTYWDLICEKQVEHEWLLLSDFLDIKPKKHTIRRDVNDRWKAGNDIHFYIYSRTKNQYQFAPVLKCLRVQKIEITEDDLICEQNCMEPTILIDNKPLSLDECEKLAVNDGFDNIQDFLAYFNEDFEGKLIHWTNLKY